MRFNAIVFGLLVLAAAFHATGGDRRTDAKILTSEGFLGAHPDIKFRLLGLEFYDKGHYDHAFERFRRAARYGDKPSQAMVAEMLWQGTGVPQDRALAYAWMDLAAERNYRSMVLKRETYWAALSDAERQRALEAGQAVYRDYGDDAAQPRLERKLRQAKLDITGSHLGYVGSLDVLLLRTPGGRVKVDGEDFYQPDFWEPERYWAWQDKTWNAPVEGKVQIGPLDMPSAD